MIQYKDIIQFLKKQNVDILLCDFVQTISHESFLAYRLKERSLCDFFHNLISCDQQVYIIVEKGAVCSLSSLQDLQFVIKEKCKIEFNIIVLEDAKFNMNFSFINSADLFCTINLYLQGDRSIINIHGLYAISDNQKILININQYHYGVDSCSKLIVNGILKNNSHATFNGLVKIAECAKGSDAFQENKNIILGSGPKVVSIPSLEILNFDVQCCHGSAIGKFDQDNIWYLQSKGIFPEKIQEMLIKSFFQNIVNGLSNSEEIIDIICKKMK